MQRLTKQSIIAGFALLAGLSFLQGGADAATRAERSAASKLEHRLAGQRVTVDIAELSVNSRPNKIYLGLLKRDDTFRVRKLSASGKYAYGFAYGHADTHGWVRTAALATGKNTAPTSAKLRVIGTPSVRYRILKDAQLGRYVSIEAVLRLNRAPGSSSQHAITAPTLRSGQKLPQQIFGGATLRTLQKEGPCYVGQVSQLRQRTGLNDRTWRLGLFSKGEVVTTPLRVTLKRDDGNDWQRAAARRLGC